MSRADRMVRRVRRKGRRLRFARILAGRFGTYFPDPFERSEARRKLIEAWFARHEEFVPDRPLFRVERVRAYVRGQHAFEEVA